VIAGRTQRPLESIGPRPTGRSAAERASVLEAFRLRKGEPGESPYSARGGIGIMGLHTGRLEHRIWTTRGAESGGGRAGFPGGCDSVGSRDRIVSKESLRPVCPCLDALAGER
jgi:hypothetical protein